MVEAIGKNKNFQECLYDENRGEIKTLMLKDETSKWNTTRRMRRKIQKDENKTDDE